MQYILIRSSFMQQVFLSSQPLLDAVPSAPALLQERNHDSVTEAFSSSTATLDHVPSSHRQFTNGLKTQLFSLPRKRRRFCDCDDSREVLLCFTAVLFDPYASIVRQPAFTRYEDYELPTPSSWIYGIRHSGKGRSTGGR